MDMTTGLLHGKPEPLKRTRARRTRQDDTYAATVRAKVIDRDHGCRVFWESTPRLAGYCAGPLQVAHLRGKRRSATMKQAPALRHSTAWECQLCQHHHTMEEHSDLTHEYLSDRGADGPMRWSLRP